MKPYPEAEVEAAQVTAVSARGSYTSEIQCVCEDGWVSVYTDLGGFVAWCASQRTHTHTQRWWNDPVQTHRASTWKRNDISMCLCHLTLSAHQDSLQRKAAVEWVAMKSRHDPQIVGEQHESTPLVGRGRGRRGRGWYRKSEQRELSTNWNGNWSSLHNLRLMRKQQQMKPPSFPPV